MKLFKKLISILVFLLVCFNSVYPSALYAQELTFSPSPEPTAVAEIEVENVAEVTNEVESDSNTGENEVEILPTESPTATPISEVVVIEPTGQPEPTPESEIVTSDATSVVEVENNINSNIVNSEFVHHTLNIYLPESESLDLSLLTSNVMNKVYGLDNNLSEIVSVRVVGIDNFAYVENNIQSVANTGQNEINGEGLNSSVATGDSYSVVSVLNNINTNIVDSKIHLVTINIFGNMTGNIMLPEIINSGLCSNCNLNTNVSLSNNAIVNNQIQSSSNTGNNSILATGSAEVNTGDAQSVTNVLNLVNTNFVNTVFRYLYINTLGAWVGDFLGWMEDGLITDSNVAINSVGNGLANDDTADCVYCSSNAIGGTNVAVVNNNISSVSNTGSNNINGSDDANIKTGNAYSSVSLLNLVNSNFVNSNGFVGFINIFGSLVGDVGGTSLFVEEDNEDLIETVVEDQNIFQRETGGLFDLSHTNNVGTHVLPGDTVTFIAKIKNAGYGKIYNAKLEIELYKDGKSYGGTYFNLGDINAQKTLKLTTGLVISKKALSGKYIARVTVTGIVGPGDTEISASSDSEFKIIGFNTVLSSGSSFPVVESKPLEIVEPEVLGTATSNNMSKEEMMIIIFGFLLFLYLGLKGIQKRHLILNYAYRIGSLLM